MRRVAEMGGHDLGDVIGGVGTSESVRGIRHIAEPLRIGEKTVQSRGQSMGRGGDDFRGSPLDQGLRVSELMPISVVGVRQKQCPPPHCSDFRHERSPRSSHHEAGAPELGPDVVHVLEHPSRNAAFLVPLPKPYGLSVTGEMGDF